MTGFVLVSDSCRFLDVRRDNLSDERTALQFTIAAGTRQRSHSRVLITQDSWPYFTVSIWDSPNLEGKVPVCISPRKRGWASSTLQELVSYTPIIRIRFRLFCYRQSVGQSVLVSGPHLGPMTRIFLLSDICDLHLLWREDGSVIYSYNLQSLLRRSPAEYTAIFYCLIWDSRNLENQAPVFVSLRKRMVQLYPRALSKSKLSYNWQLASLSWCQTSIRAREQFLFLLEIFFRILQDCYFVTPSLTRGWVCNLLLLLVLYSAVPLRSESRETKTHTLLSKLLRLLQPGGQGPRIYIPQ
jgi:hypothetical protein